MMHIKKLLFLLLFATSSFAQVRNLSTTKMMSTAGAGTGSLSMEETAFQNPASIAFFRSSSFYYQNNSTDIVNKNNKEESEYGSSEAYVISDTSGPFSGSFSYQRQSENNATRKRFTGTMARAVNGDTSIGLLYNHTRDLTKLSEGGTKDNYNQITLGTTHIVSKNLILGATIDDVFGQKDSDSTGTVGLQYDYQGIIFLLADFGANYRLGVSGTSFWSAATQFRFFDDIYLRVGRFANNQQNTIGTGWGISWIGPKMGLHFGALQMNRLNDQEDSILMNNERLDELSFSLSIQV